MLLDIQMPGIDGYETCRRIRADERTAYLPVVMVTASGEQQRLSALESGADDFVTKPFNQAELLARVASLARIKRYHDTIHRQAGEHGEVGEKAPVDVVPDHVDDGILRDGGREVARGPEAD